MIRWLLGLDPCWLTGHWWIHTHAHERINEFYVVSTHESTCWRCGKEHKSTRAEFQPVLSWPPPDPLSDEGLARYRYLLRLEAQRDSQIAS